jgi:hypothetical protein
MRSRVVSVLALFLLVPVLAAADKPAAPTLTLRLPALDDLIADLRYLAEQAGRGEEAKQFEKLVKSLGGDKGIEGLDPKKPLALYAYLGGAGIDSKVVLLLPIADQKAFLDRITLLGIKAKEEKGLYEFQPKGSPFPAYFRFANGYVYGTVRDKDMLGEQKLLAPAAVMPPGEKDMLALALDLTGFPENLRDILVGQLDLRAADFKEKQPNETKDQAAFRGAVIDDSIRFLKMLLTDSGQLTLRFAVDRQAGDVSLSVGLSGQKNSPLAKSLASLAEVKSSVAGLISSDASFASRMTYQLSEDLRKKLGPVVDEGLQQLLSSTKDQGEKELIRPLVESLAPTLKQGKIDVALEFRGPSEKKLYTVVAGTALKDGAAIEKALKNLVAKLPDNAKERISFDVAKESGINIHRLNVEKDLDAEAKKSLGENPIYIAIRGDAVFAGLGEDGLNALKGALGAKSQASPVMRIEVSMLRIASLVAVQQKHAPKAAEEAFAKNKSGDKFFISLEGGKDLRIRVGMSGAVLRFFALLDKAEKEDKQD